MEDPDGELQAGKNVIEAAKKVSVSCKAPLARQQRTDFCQQPRMRHQLKSASYILQLEQEYCYGRWVDITWKAPPAFAAQSFADSRLAAGTEVTL